MPVEDPFKNIVTFVEIGRGLLARVVFENGGLVVANDGVSINPAGLENFYAEHFVQCI